MMCAHRSLSALVWALAVAHLALISTTALDLTPAQQVRLCDELSETACS